MFCYSLTFTFIYRSPPRNCRNLCICQNINLKYNIKSLPLTLQKFLNYQNIFTFNSFQTSFFSLFTLIRIAN